MQQTLYPARMQLKTIASINSERIIQQQQQLTQELFIYKVKLVKYYRKKMKTQYLFWNIRFASLSWSNFRCYEKLLKSDLFVMMVSKFNEMGKQWRRLKNDRFHVFMWTCRYHTRLDDGQADVI